MIGDNNHSREYSTQENDDMGKARSVVMEWLPGACMYLVTLSVPNPLHACCMKSGFYII